MIKKLTVPAAALPVLGLAALLLAGCDDPHPLWGPGTPQNGADEYVTPQGIVIPGSPMPTGPVGR